MKTIDGTGLYHDAIRRIHELEALNATLAAEIDRLCHEYDEEVSEFKAGFEAAQRGLPDTSEPSRVKHDVWMCGYAWQRYSSLVAQIDRMTPVVEAAQSRAQSLGEIHPDGLTGDEIVLVTKVRLYQQQMAALTKGTGG